MDTHFVLLMTVLTLVQGLALAGDDRASAPDHGGGKQVGMRVSVGDALNGGFTSTPQEMRCTPVPDPLGRHGNFGVNLCPSKPKRTRTSRDSRWSGACPAVCR